LGKWEAFDVNFLPDFGTELTTAATENSVHCGVSSNLRLSPRLYKSYQSGTRGRRRIRTPQSGAQPDIYIMDAFAGQCRVRASSASASTLTATTLPRAVL